MPVVVEGGRTVPEATIIIEYLDLYHPGAVRLVPEDRRAALDVRMLDRFFDNYVMTPMQKIVSDSFRNAEHHDPQGVGDARQLLDTAYRWLDSTLAGPEWAAGAAFSLADCAGAPALFYADWVHPIGAAFANVRAYRQRLLARPSFARAVDEARPYRRLFPLGAPDRD
jgi:glutathione S-transferase